MVQDNKKKGMDDMSDKKGRAQVRDEDEKNSSNRSTGKTSSTHKNDSSSSRKSR